MAQSSSLGQVIYGGASLSNNQCLISTSGRFALLMQNDGNLLIYDRSSSPARSIWATATTATVYDPAYVATTLYSYDALGNLTRVEQHGNTSDSTQWRTRTFTYDSLSRLTQSNNPESGQMTYAYDADGNLITKTDARGVITTYAYDPLHRLTGKTYSDGTPSVTNTYDQGCCGVTPSNAIGRLTASFSGNTEQIFSYDPMGRLITQWDCPPSGIARGFCYVISALYDQLGEMKSLTYPDGRNVTMGYNVAGRATRVTLSGYNGTALSYPYYTVPQSTSAASWGYWPTGAVDRGTFGNGVVETSSYNNRLQLSSVTEAKGAQTLFSKTFGYYDAANHNNGNILSIADGLATTRNQTYQYDSWNRILTAAQADNAFNITFSIDPWGNMHESGTSNFTQPFDSRNRILSYSYDAAGNMASDGLHLYSFDAENRIKTVDTSVAAYTYNAAGNRVRKDLSSGSSTEYFYFGGNVIAELDPAAGAYTDYIFGNGRRIARDASSNGSGVQYYHDDQLGTTRIMTDASGTKISDCTYAPFGEEVSCSPNNAANHYKFSGKERDSESGLDYFGARYLSSAMGRFTSPDPLYLEAHRLVDPQQWNIYAYARNNPLKFIDPTGLDVTCTGNRCNDYLGALQKDVSFKVTMDKKGKIGTEGNIDKKHLSKTEKQLLKAIGDTKHHVTINAIGGGNDSSVFFGASHGASHTIAFDQAALLDSPKNAGGMTSAQLVGHETLEGYAESKGESLQDAHDFANGFFPGFDRPTGGTAGARTATDLLSIHTYLPIHGTGVTENVEFRFNTPIPIQSINNGTAQRTPGVPVDVQVKK